MGIASVVSNRLLKMRCGSDAACHRRLFFENVVGRVTAHGGFRRLEQSASFA